MLVDRDAFALDCIGSAALVAFTPVRCNSKFAVDWARFCVAVSAFLFSWARHTGVANIKKHVPMTSLETTATWVGASVERPPVGYNAVGRTVLRVAEFHFH
jgi:hypothetical protein